MGPALAGKVAIVTGGANGLGRGVVDLFVEEGARVVIADVDEAAGRDAATQLGEAARFKRVDVARREDIQALVDFAVAEFGGLQVMVNNAAVPDPWYGSLLDDELSSFERIMSINVLGVMLGAQCAARHMALNGGGSIINVASIAGIRPGNGVFTYRASKAGVVNFTQSAAIDLGPHGIRVNCICPGNIPTEMAEYNRPGAGVSAADLARVHSAVNAVRMTRQPLKRQGRPRDVGEAALFLASDRSSQMTGLIMPVDGGATAGDPLNLIDEIMDARAKALGSAGEVG